MWVGLHAGGRGQVAVVTARGWGAGLWDWGRGDVPGGVSSSGHGCKPKDSTHRAGCGAVGRARDQWTGLCHGRQGHSPVGGAWHPPQSSWEATVTPGPRIGLGAVTFAMMGNNALRRSMTGDGARPCRCSPMKAEGGRVRRQQRLCRCSVGASSKGRTQKSFGFISKLSRESNTLKYTQTTGDSQNSLAPHPCISFPRSPAFLPKLSWHSKYSVGSPEPMDSTQISPLIHRAPQHPKTACPSDFGCPPQLLPFFLQRQRPAPHRCCWMAPAPGDSSDPAGAGPGGTWEDFRGLEDIVGFWTKGVWENLRGCLQISMVLEDPKVVGWLEGCWRTLGDWRAPQNVRGP